MRCYYFVKVLIRNVILYLSSNIEYVDDTIFVSKNIINAQYSLLLLFVIGFFYYWSLVTFYKLLAFAFIAFSSINLGLPFFFFKFCTLCETISYCFYLFCAFLIIMLLISNIRRCYDLVKVFTRNFILGLSSNMRVTVYLLSELLVFLL